MNDSKQHIIRVATGLFLQKSFKEVTMKELVDASGLSKGAFYHYFPGKEALYNEIVERFILQFANVDYSRFNQESLKQFYSDYLSYVSESFMELQKELGNDSVSVNYFTLLFDAMKLFPHIRDKALEIQEKELASWQRLISKARDNGEIRPESDPEALAQLFVFSHDGAGIRFIISQDMSTIEQTMKRIWDTLYAMIRS